MLRRICSPDEMAFTTTDEIEKLDGIIGQERATRAIEFGIEIEAEGYNIFAMGPSGAGKSSTICCAICASGRMNERRRRIGRMCAIPTTRIGLGRCRCRQDRGRLPASVCVRSCARWRRR